MKSVSPIALALSLAASGTQAWAADDAQHDVHHPAGAASAPAAKAAIGKPKAAMMGGGAAQMKSMHDVHEKLMAARTPDERNALMSEHMKIMQDGMAMMKKPSTGMQGNFVRNQMMEERMELMEAMMEMMMDRLPAAPSK